ncbi:toxin-antitoxin system HicB family antitoxin [Xenorhabdus bovienii]|nr:toxin-antitoxin system HicB family antitoxin [Xenorhabdus bovienii]
MAEYVETCTEEGINPFKNDEKLKSFTLR